MIIKSLLFICTACAIISCGNNSTSPEQNTGTTAAGNTGGEDVSDIAMFKSYDCATCHKRTEAYVGPSFADIAQRYSNAVDTTVSRLALTVINGSSGKWSSAAMTAHPALSKSDAENMVKYILQVKK